MTRCGLAWVGAGLLGAGFWGAGLWGAGLWGAGTACLLHASDLVAPQTVGSPPPELEGAAQGRSPGRALTPGIDRRGIDESVRPQDHLFAYANGEWLKHTPIPAHKSTYGAFEILDDEADIKIHEIIMEAAEGTAPQGSLLQQIGDLYKSYMNVDAIESRGLAPLAEVWQDVDALQSHGDLAPYFGRSQVRGIDCPIGFYVGIDDKDSANYLATIVQSGISLPDRDYYLKDDEKYASARRALTDYIEQLYVLSGRDDGPEAGQAILALETELADIQWERIKLRDAHLRYNKHTLEALTALAPQLDWKAFFHEAEVVGLAQLNVATPSFFVELERLVAATPVETWRHYLRFRAINAYAAELPEPFFQAWFDLYRRELAGVDQPQPRWKRAVGVVAGERGFGALGDAVGQLYVERHFPAEAAERMDALVANLVRAFELSIHELTWMTPVTKTRALEKLAKITPKIGHTSSWRDYSGLEISADDLVGNLFRSAALEHHRMVAKLGHPVDQSEWHMTPHTINAYYSPTMNEIVFPAAILQPPFFDIEAEDAANYGSIGAVIGHEISHAFDDQGSKYDGDGNLNDWWTAEDRAQFQLLADKLVEQFDGYTPLDGRRVNGRLTLGENIADLSGMSVAYKAYILSLAGAEPPAVDGWTGPQRFFLSWSQSWRRKYRDGELVSRLLTDPHSPAAFRSDGPLVNFDPFYDAFQIGPEDNMYKPADQRIRVW